MIDLKNISAADLQLVADRVVARDLILVAGPDTIKIRNRAGDDGGRPWVCHAAMDRARIGNADGRYQNPKTDNNRFHGIGLLNIRRFVGTTPLGV